MNFGEDSQLVVPDAFVQIYTDPWRHRLTIPKQELLQRFELCDDLANLLTDKAAEQKFTAGLEEVEVLAQISAGPRQQDSGLPDPEIEWVVNRVGELLGW